MEIIACLLSLSIGFFIGYKLHKIELLIKKTTDKVETKVDKKMTSNVSSTVIDPLDPIQQAMYEHRQMMKDLNGQDYEE